MWESEESNSDDSSGEEDETERQKKEGGRENNKRRSTQATTGLTPLANEINAADRAKASTPDLEVSDGKS